MTAKKKGPDRVVLDAAALDIPRAGTTVSIAELINEGTSEDRRYVLGVIGTRIRLNHPRIPPITEDIREWLGAALEAIGRGEDPKTALGLTRKTKHGPAYRKTLAHMVNDLMKQGMARSEAESIAGRYNHEAQSLEPDPADTATARVRKILKPKNRKK